MQVLRRSIFAAATQTHTHKPKKGSGGREAGSPCIEST